MTIWPTSLGKDGTAPVLLVLLGSDDVILARQAAYSLFTARSLQEAGYSIEGFQLPIPDPGGSGITIPFMMKNAKGLLGAVYTQSEPWTEALVRDLNHWIASARALGLAENVPVFVACQWAPPPAGSAPGVRQFLPIPQQNLPGTSAAAAEPPAKPVPPDDSGTPAEAVRMAEQFVTFARDKSMTVLDYSPRSLSSVDAILEKARAQGIRKEDVSGWIYAAGCYVGEVFVRNAGAQWRPVPELGGMAKMCSWPIALALPDGSAINPIGKALKRFENGSGDSVAFLWAALANMGKLTPS